MIMLLCHRLRVPQLPAAAVLLLCAVPLVPAAAAAAPAGIADANAAIVSAETALQRGDCGAASALYRQAVQKLAQVELATRAAAVALSCGQFPSARALAERWLELAPGDADAMLALLQAQLGGYQIADARRQFKALIGRPGAKVAEIIDALAQRAGNEPLLVMLRDFDDANLRGAEAQLALAALALEGWDARLAIRYAQRARAAGASAANAAAISARAYAVLGDAQSATAEARATATDKGVRLTLAQALLMLGQDEAAQAELQRLRTDPDVGTAAARLLAQAAMESGEYAVAEQRCQDLLQDPGSAPLAVYYLGLIAERRGDDAVASRDYALLTGTSFESQGRRRAARILYRQGERDAAVRVLIAARDAEPDERIRGELAAAELLSVSGAADEGLSRVDGALRRAPGNPEIAYQRAVLLERAGRVDAAIAALEALHRERPLDANAANALGFTLADHKRDLKRAEQLVRAALVSQPDNPAVLDSLGWVLYRRGQGAAALPPLERAYRLLHDGDIGAHWGEALWAAGQKGAARAAWQRALAADPDNKLLGATVQRYAPTIKAPKPPPALEPAPRTSI
jgi:tetratricopeptide (TPR) repeat protein